MRDYAEAARTFDHDQAVVAALHGNLEALMPVSNAVTAMPVTASWH